MSEFFDVASSAGRYAVEIVSGSYRRFVGEGKKVVAICDERFAGDLQQAGVKSIPLRSDESAKNLASIPGVVTALRQAGVTRDTCLLAVGGGVVQDVAAFCAAIYMRGLEWVYVPTTLLGMADSCIGGKSSINVGEYKNIVGTFNPPRRVLIDPDFVATLSAEQIGAGLIEAAKICFCRGSDAWRVYLACQPSLGLSREGFTRVIATSLFAKKWFIEVDEFDRKERLLLNFGHTFGHALEGASGFRVSHGIAVGIGMLCALALGRRMGSVYEGVPQVEELRSHVSGLLSAVAELPDALRGVAAVDLFDRFAADKKHTAETYRVVAVANDGRAELVSLPKNDNAQNQIVYAMNEILCALQAGSAVAA
jgi:3-dehydroquinate synthase